MNKAERLNFLFANRKTDPVAFWQYLTKYTRMISAWMLNDQSAYADDVTSNVIARILNKIDSLNIYEDSTFSKWLKVVIRHEVGAIFRANAESKEVNFSDLPLVHDEEGGLSPIEAEDLPAAAVPFLDTFSEDINEERFAREDLISDELDAFYKLLNPTDQAIFSMLREGTGWREVGKKLGLAPSTVGGRVQSWKLKASRIQHTREYLEGIKERLTLPDDIKLYRLLARGCRPSEANRVCGKTDNWAYNRIVSWRRMARREENEQQSSVGQAGQAGEVHCRGVGVVED